MNVLKNMDTVFLKFCNFKIEYLAETTLSLSVRRCMCIKAGEESLS